MQQEPFKIVNITNARERMLAGVELGYHAVSSTFGPRSANVAIKRPFGAPAVIHDGVKVFRSLLPLEDQEMDAGAEIALEASTKTNDSAGDGTTQAAILIYEIAKAAHKYITAGARPMALRSGIEIATDAVLAELDKLAIPIDVKKDADKLLMVATISAQVPDIGEMVAQAYAKLGKEAILTVEESRTTDTSLELKQGMQFDKGWISPYFISPDNKFGESVVDSPYILVTDMPLRDLEAFNEMLIKLADQEGVKKLVVIADRYEVPVAAYFIKNHLKGAIQGLMVEAPAFGEKRLDILRDIAIVTGATLISESAGLSLGSVTKDMLGRAKRVTATKETTLIVEGAGTKDAVNKRIAEIRQQLKNADLSAFDSEKLYERLARMDSGVGVLSIGARSEPELKERVERAIDAKSAAKAALSEGIVPGGGMAIITAAEAAKKGLAEDKRLADDFDVRSGANIVFEACKAPFKKLLTNAGYDPGEYWAKLEGKPAGTGVDVMDGEIVDMIKAGIIDPVMVIKAALGHASSAAVALSTSSTVVTMKISDVQTNV